MQTIFKTFDEKRRKIHALIKFGEVKLTVLTFLLS